MTVDGRRPAHLPKLRLLGMPAAGAGATATCKLWCDPLTGLVAYPSFQEHLTQWLPTLAPAGLHLAIGDIDNLKEYITQRRGEDPTMFGHLAGNDCMERLGATTREWAQLRLASWHFSLCGTFGGDEVIIAASGFDYGRFVRHIRELMSDIGRSLPRTCSFASGTLTTSDVCEGQARQAYRHLVSRVDLALFIQKAEIRSRNSQPRGDFKDVGSVPLPDPRLNGRLTASAEPPLPSSGAMAPAAQSQQRGA
jgi:GGDEF domain-containing protein